ncbi:unnamed protein product [Sphenostylis stenocarpa]|uniref:PGG domain-containing protein n=1 Tax=Sphenostylis stenocarpa TaxID=92480 RepID=A0AA86SUI6_9FABA|nr:unnamed protein product [Sphenostylis stenocarpa]
MEDPSVTMNTGREKIDKTKWWRKYVSNVGNWLTHKDKDKWLKNIRGNLSLVATVIATITFQSALNPPGGVRPAKDGGEDLVCPANGSPCPGESVLAYTTKDEYSWFLIWNTTCFLSSSAVCLLLVSGFPLNHRFFTWLLSVGMCITITSLTLTYMYGAQMVTPDPVWAASNSMFLKVIYIWTSLLGLVTFVLCLRLFIWIVTNRDGKKPRK